MLLYTLKDVFTLSLTFSLISRIHSLSCTHTHADTKSLTCRCVQQTVNASILKGESAILKKSDKRERGGGREEKNDKSAIHSWGHVCPTVCVTCHVISVVCCSILQR